MDGPSISGGEGSYDFGDNVTLNCTSAKSKPAAKLSWLVNGQLVDDNETMDHGTILVDSNLEVTSKTLQLPVTERLLSKGKVAIKCEASFYGRVAMISRDITIIGKTSQSFRHSTFDVPLSAIFYTRSVRQPIRVGSVASRLIRELESRVSSEKEIYGFEID
ncbi:hypothetical protein CDAR_260231 [Caerostris darwini]|nr:hypothetical protein CDAR_260231 [Caerostris darwini]